MIMSVRSGQIIHLSSFIFCCVTTPINFFHRCTEVALHFGMPRPIMVLSPSHLECSSMQTFRNWGVGAKLTFVTFLSLAAAFTVFVLLVTQSTSALLEKRAAESVASEARGVANMIDLFNRAELTGVEKFSRVFQTSFPSPFSIDASREVDTGGTKAPVLKHGLEDMNMDFNIVDQFTAKTGVTATVFMKTGDDFLRVSTSVKKANGDRAVGTKLDRQHPGYAVLMKGQTF